MASQEIKQRNVTACGTPSPAILALPANQGPAVAPDALGLETKLEFLRAGWNLPQEVTYVRTMIGLLGGSEEIVFRAAEADLESRTREDLDEVFEEASVGGWDGEGASPLLPQTHDYARRFLKLLPSWTPSPYVAPFPGGQVGFEWRAGDNGILVVTVGPDGRIAFSGRFNESRTRGTDLLGGDASETIVSSLRRLFAKNGRTSQTR